MYKTSVLMLDGENIGEMFNRATALEIRMQPGAALRRGSGPS